MLGQYNRSIERLLFSEDDVFVLLSNGVTTTQTESEILTANDQALQQNIMQQEYYKRHLITNAKLLRDNTTHYFSIPLCKVTPCRLVNNCRHSEGVE